MGRRLQGLGVFLFVATVGLWVAEVVGWIPRSTDDRWWGVTLKGAAIALAAGTLLRIVSPVTGRIIASGRCVVCGRSTEAGRAYCPDHLRQTVNDTRDEARDLEIRRSKPARPTGR